MRVAQFFQGSSVRGRAVRGTHSRQNLLARRIEGLRTDEGPSMSPPTSSRLRAHSKRHIYQLANPHGPAVGATLAQAVDAVSDPHRGPSGAPPPPPKDLATTRLPVTVLN